MLFLDKHLQGQILLLFTFLEKDVSTECGYEGSVMVGLKTTRKKDKWY